MSIPSGLVHHRKEVEVPTLQFVATSDLVLHEQHDASRLGPLIERLTKDGILRNPPIVTPIQGHGRFVVLDGANRAAALARLGIPHAVVQVVDYEDPDLLLDSWYHLVAEIQQDEFAEIQDIPGIALEKVELLHARAALARRQALAYIVWPGGQVCTACCDVDDLHARATLLNALVEVYRYRGRIYRVSTDQLDQVAPYYQNVTALVVFPHYEPAEIIELARNGARLPAGITRHVIPRRALRLNIPLAELAADKTLAEKNDWLEAWMRRKLADKEIRYYQESTWLFDE